MKKRALSLLLALALCMGLTIPALADQEFDLQGEHTSGAYTYSLLSDGTAMIVAFNKNFSTYVDNQLETLSIPAELDGYKVTSLGLYSFSYHMPAGIKTVIIPEGVVYINDAAFSYPNRTTTTLSLPSTLKSIGNNAFNGWTALNTLVIPENVATIGKNAFFIYEPGDNEGLKTVICYSKDVKLSRDTVFSYFDTPFSGCMNCTFYGYPGSTLETQFNAYYKSYNKSVQQADGSYKEEKVSTGNTFLDISEAPDVNAPVTQPDPVEPDPVEPVGSVNFTDVPAGMYYAEPVAWAVEQNITTGTTATTFSPEETCTRGQIITFLWRAAGSPQPAGENPFEDVAEGAYYAAATAWAAEQGMAEGTAFAPEAPCTREMAVEFMWKHAGSPDAAEAGFEDVTSDAVNWAVEAGVTYGTSDTAFSPDDTCTRGQIVTFLWRAFA